MQERQPGPALKGKFISARILRRVDLTEDLWRVWLQPSEPFTFKAGQYCTIGTAGLERPYSIASPPSEPQLELFIEHIPPPIGQLTPHLYKLKNGDEVSLRPRAKGLFVFQPKYTHHIMVATVTGVAPYIAILREQLANARESDRFHVLEGASFQDEFGYDKELNAMELASNGKVTFFPSVSRPQDSRNKDWKGATGRINTLVESYLERIAVPPAETCVYLCGHPSMIEDVKHRLDGTEYHVEEERFWKEEEAS